MSIPQERTQRCNSSARYDREDMLINRREWLIGSLSAAFWADVAEAQQKVKFTVLDSSTASEVETIAAQILPSDDGPGAREAGVIYFIDRALATFDSDQRDAYRKGMAEFQQARAKMFPGSTSIAALHPEQQIALLRSVETTAFFDLLRTHTVLGFLGNPSYGGNRGQIGWKHIGFEHRMAWAPPFGYYDGEGAK
jgi:gluconate 2-dehydrogenase gamma chain